MAHLLRTRIFFTFVILFLFVAYPSRGEFKPQLFSSDADQAVSELANSQNPNQDLIEKCKQSGGDPKGVDFAQGGIRCSIQDSSGLSKDYTFTKDFVQPVGGNGEFSLEASCMNTGGQLINGLCIQATIHDNDLDDSADNQIKQNIDRTSNSPIQVVKEGITYQQADIKPKPETGNPEQAKEFSTAVTSHETSTTSSEVCSNLEKQVAQCEERGKNTVSICDPNTNKDMVQFSQGMAGLNKMLAAAAQSGAANKMASCALSAGTNSLASLVTGDYGDSCQYEVSACRNVCEIGLDYLKTNAALAQSCASVAARAQRIFDSVYEKCSRSDVSTQAMKAVAGLGQNAMAGMKCAQDGGKKSKSFKPAFKNFCIRKKLTAIMRNSQQRIFNSNGSKML